MAEDDARTQPVEAPEPDVHEQRREVAALNDAANDAAADAERDPEEPDLPPAELPRHLPGDVDPADAYEQARSVDYDEDDYR